MYSLHYINQVVVVSNTRTSPPPPPPPPLSLSLSPPPPLSRLFLLWLEASLPQRWQIRGSYKVWVSGHFLVHKT